MFNFSVPEHALGSELRVDFCRAEVQMALEIVIRDAVNKGWLEGEVAMAMADVAEEHIIALAKKKCAPLLRVVAKH